MRKKTKAGSALPEVKADENGGIAIAEGAAQHWRIHHHVKWGNCAAKIISAKWRKGK